MGSSMVTTWPWRVREMSWMMAASVVDLPEPVGPVMSTNPAGNWAKVATTSGRFNSS